MDEPPRLDRELMRQEVEEEVRGEYAKQDLDERFQEFQTARQAMLIWKWILIVAGTVIGIPLLGFLVGLSIRLFYLASGL